MNNLAYPALASLIVNFFYTSPNSMGSLFPKVFGNKVSCTPIVLAATTIKLALDKVAMEAKEVVFKHDIYVDVYVDILSLMVKCNTNPIHRTKTKMLCIQWAKIRRNSGAATTATGFDVNLD